MTGGLTGQHRRAKQVIPGVAVIKNHSAKGEVAVFDFTLSNGVGWNSWIGAVDDCRQSDTSRDRDTDGLRCMCYWEFTTIKGTGDMAP